MSTSLSDELVPIILVGTIVDVEVSGDDSVLLTYSDGRQVVIASPVGSLYIAEDGLLSQ
jgi:hypothetical protein